MTTVFRRNVFRRPVFLRFTLSCLLLTLSTTAASADPGSDRWGQFRGPWTDGKDVTRALPEGDFGLTVAWTRELGSGYSNVSMADGKAITMFTHDEVDVVAAFDVASGDELWRYELGSKYAGHDGSTDGPLSTPTIVGDAVFVLGPTGQLAALGLADGAEKWRQELNEENSTVPFYGYTSSPVVTGDVVIVATGGEGHAITAYDRADGEVRWTAGDDSVTYQTPMILELAGRSLLLALTDRYLAGMDPTNGNILWHHQHTDGEQREGSAHASPVDGERFLVKYQRGAKMYRASAGGVEEVWETNAFANTFALPVRVGDLFYGFTGRFLTAASVETGEIAWRSRPPGGQGVSLIGSTLAVVAPSGDLVLVEPSAEGYTEKARVAALDAGDYAFPSFADDVFVVRNLSQMAAVRIDRSAAPKVAEVTPADRLKGEFGRWIASLEAKPEGTRQGLVDAKFADVETTPLHGANGLVHFVWRGEAKDVGLAGDPAPQAGQEIGLHHVAGTDLFFTSLELDPKAQYAYTFTVDFGARPVNDPTNPYTIDNGFAVASDLRMPEWPASPHLEEPAEDAPRGSLDTFQFRSEVLENTRELKVWRPATYGQNPETRYPLLVVNHGDNLLRGGLMQNTLDNLVGESVAPLIAVFVPRSQGAEYGGPQVDNYVKFLLEELLPHMDRHYLTDGENRAIMGPGSAGVTAVYAAVQHPSVFKKAAVQSFYPIPPSEEHLPEMIAKAESKPEHVYVIWSRHDYAFDPARRSDDASKALVEQLRGVGVNVTHQIADYSPGWGGWRGQDDDILTTFFPAPAAEESE